MDVVPNAPEGLILAFCERYEKEYGFLKIVTDCMFVSLGILLSVIFLGGVFDIREGTVLSALVTGKITGVFLKQWKPGLAKLAFAEENFVKEKSQTAQSMEK